MKKTGSTIKTVILFLLIVCICSFESILADASALGHSVAFFVTDTTTRRIAFLIILGAVFCASMPLAAFIVYALFQLIANLFIFTYIANLANAPLLISVNGAWDAALEMGPDILTFISPLVLGVLLFSFFLKILLFRWLCKNKPARLKRALVALLALAGIICIHAYIYTKEHAHIFGQVPAPTVDTGVVAGAETLPARFMAGRYGLANTWLYELLTGTYNVAQITNYKASYSSAIDKLPLLPLSNNILLVQMESFDYSLLHMKYNGQEVTPFINSLAAQSIVIPVNMRRKVGSANSDYEMFSANPAVMPIIYYMHLSGRAYQDFLIAKARQLGYATTLVANIEPGAFGSGAAYKAMGFSERYYEGDLLKYFPEAKRNSGYPFLGDQKMFEFAAAKIKHNEKQLMFAITMSMHPPFNDNAGYFGTGSEFERYISTARYCDEGLKNLVNSLPQGSLVVIWGDHISEINYGKEAPGSKLVPVIVHRTGSGLDYTWQEAPLNSLYEAGIYLNRLFQLAEDN